MKRENEALQSRINQLEAEAEATKDSSISAHSGSSSEPSSVLGSMQSTSATSATSAGHTFDRAIEARSVNRPRALNHSGADECGLQEPPAARPPSRTKQPTLLQAPTFTLTSRGLSAHVPV